MIKKPCWIQVDRVILVNLWTSGGQETNIKFFIWKYLPKKKQEKKFDTGYIWLKLIISYWLYRYFKLSTCLPNEKKYMQVVCWLVYITQMHVVKVLDRKLMESFGSAKSVLEISRTTTARPLQKKGQDIFL